MTGAHPRGQHETARPAPIVVLKLGGSVLRSADDLARAAIEVYRHVRSGTKVIAVVSALHGETDRLLETAAAWDGADHPEATALLASTGELAAAAQLALAVARSGLSVRVATPATMGLRAAGPAHDAEPAGVDTGAICLLLRHASVLVVPGFIATNEAGATVLLGRGGSDLTAIYLASRLSACGCDARCRLIKDVPGLFDRDPNIFRDAHRLATVSWQEALDIGGEVLQPKAVRLALRTGTPIEIGGMLDPRTTRVGPYERTLDEKPFAPPRRSVSVLGCGTVGAGLLRLLRLFPERFELAAVACRHPEHAAREGVPAERIHADPREAAAHGEIVVEALGGVEPATSCMVDALARGALVATANKAAAAAHGRLHGAGVALSACVGGAAPMLERCLSAGANLDHKAPDEPSRHSPIARLEGVLNGTGNFVLNRMAAGDTLGHALAAARAAGLAEADATRDLGGHDTADKLRLLARAAFGEDVPPQAIEIEPITTEAFARVRAHAPPHWRIRHVATLLLADPATCAGAARLCASIRLVALPPEHPLAVLAGAWNRLVLHVRGNGQEHTDVVDGVGAGRWPTAHALLADVLDLHERASAAPLRVPCADGPARTGGPCRNTNNVQSQRAALAMSSSA